MMEYSSNGLVTQSTAIVDTRGVDSLANSIVESTDFQARCYEPNMAESDVCKFATPFHSNAATATKGQQLVAQTLPALKARVGQLEAEVDTVGPIWFSDDVIEEEGVKCQYKCNLLICIHDNRIIYLK
jgi:hypothetical protein